MNFRINVSQRTDLVLREVEDLQKNLVKFVIKMKRKSNSLKAELEEIGIEQAEVNDWTKSFETIVVIEGLEEITGRIPAEKFLKLIIIKTIYIYVIHKLISLGICTIGLKINNS